MWPGLGHILTYVPVPDTPTLGATGAGAHRARREHRTPHHEKKRTWRQKQMPAQSVTDPQAA
jgi:hypothetical protein